MKIRTDFVTNSSSSNFVAVRFITENEMRGYCVGWDFDMPDNDSALEQLTALKSVEELIEYFGVSDRDILFETKGFSLDKLSMKDLKIRYSEGCVLFGADAADYLEDMEADGIQVDYTAEGAILSGYAVMFDLANKTVEHVPLDEDDGYGA